MVEKVTAAMKKKRKRWIEIIGPIDVNKAEIGHSYCDDPQLLMGRKVAVNMMHLTKDPKKQHIKLTFTIDEIKEGKAYTKFSGYEVLPSYVKRAVRRNKSKIDDSFVVETKDNLKVRIKHFTTTSEKASAPKRTQLRKAIRDYLSENVKKATYSENIKSVLNNFLQKGIKDAVKKVVPCNSMIRVFQLEK